jgi:23S rRNA (guanosine2251-2'-O)-methyltransferase
MNKKLKLWELERASEEEFKKQQKFPVVVVLDNIRSLNNVGSFFRTADAFNVEKIILCGITACPPHREINKTAIGATESMEWSYEKETMSALHSLKEDGYTICTVEQTEKTTFLQDANQLKQEKFALFFGNEVDGVDQDVVDNSDVVLEIPQFGTKHSLNVSVCAGVVIWEITKRWMDKSLEQKVNKEV